MYTLDYPNLEVRGAMARRLMDSYFDSPTGAGGVRENARKALALREPAALVGELNLYLSRVPFDYSATKKMDEFDYCVKIFALFYAMGLNFRAEEHGNLGRSDFAVECANQAWVIEVKLSHGEEGEKDEKLANDALKQIHFNNYAGGYRDPVLLGLAINDNKRIITSWECEGGNMAKPQDKTPGTEDGEKGRPGPRFRP
jgi:hypothetical protein